METRSPRSPPRRAVKAAVTWTAAALDGCIDLAVAAERLPWACGERDATGLSFTTDGGVTVHLLGRGAVLVERPAPIPLEITRALEGASGRRLQLETVRTWRIDGEGASPRGPAGAIDGRGLAFCATDTTSRRTLALLLAEAAALGRCEVVADRLIDDVSAFASNMRDAARLPWSSREAKRRTGALLEAKIELSRCLNPRRCGDRSDDRLREVLAQSLDLPGRRAAMKEQLASAEGALQTLLVLWNERHSHRLEWVIIALIAVDIVIAWWLHA